MPEASDAQVQTYVDQRMRVRAEQIRNLKAAIEDDIATIDDVYAHCVGSATWTDTRQDVPSAMTCSDILSINTSYVAIINALEDTIPEVDPPVVDFNTISSSCVRPLLD